MFRVLSIDGGGIRGIVPACVLVSLEALVNQPLGEVFDLVVGTSTGGLLALAIAAPRGSTAARTCSPAALLDLYTARGSEIFGANRVNIRSNPLMGLVPMMGGPTAGAAPWVKSLRSRLGIDKASDPGNARYSPAVLEGCLQEIFGDLKLSEAKPDVVITSYDMSGRQPVLFRSSEARADSRTDAYFRDVGRATSAAPTFFPPHVLPGDDHRVLVDGGMIANNPSLVALLEAFRMARPDELIVVLSLGTGSPERLATNAPSVEDLKSRAWPLVGVDLMQILFDGDSQLADQLLTGLSHSLPERINTLRLQANLGAVSPAMDDASSEHIRELTEIGMKLVKTNQPKLAAMARFLSAS